MNENARHIISRTIDENCDKLHPEQARRIEAALEREGYKIVKVTTTTRRPFTFDDDYCGECGGPCMRMPKHGEPWA